MWRPVDRRVRRRRWSYCSCFGGRDTGGNRVARHLEYWSCIHKAQCARTEPSTAPTCEQDWRCNPSRRCARIEPKPMPTLRAASGMVPCCWRVDRRRTGSHHKADALAVSCAKDGAGNMAVLLCSTDFPARNSEISSEPVVRIGGTRSGLSDARAMPCTLLNSSCLRRLTFDMSGSRRRRGLGPE